MSGYGVARLAGELSRAGQPVSSHAIYQWVAGSTAPRPQRAMAIVHLSGGVLSMGDIYSRRECGSDR